jgi:UDP-GlcNAc:undecaprenyl-phosphate GlcNAc-1-phosphate transferase
MLFILGIVDDTINLNYRIKFFLTIILIMLLLLLDNSFILSKINFSFFSNTIYLNKFAIPFTILCFLLFLNAFNMFDGINLQAALYSLSLFLFFIQNDLFIVLNLLMLIPLIIFITKNYNGEIFLGNNGSFLLPFFFSSLFIKNYNINNIKYADEIVICMLIPGLDMLRLFICRVYNKKNPFKADKNHLHHLIMQSSNYKNTIIIISILSFLPIFLKLLELKNILIISIVLTIYLIIYFYYRNNSKKNY